MLGVIGDVVQDIVVWTEEEIRPATDTRSTITTRRGGSAANVAAFAGPRCRTRFIGCVGDDVGGTAVTQDLADHGVDLRLQVRGDTGMVVLLIDRQGERAMFPSRGASALLEPVDPQWLHDLRMLHVTGYSLQAEPTASSVVAAARAVKDAGGRVSFDVSSTGMIDLYGQSAFIEVMQELQPDVITANRDETRMLDLADDTGPGPGLDLFPDTVLLARSGAEATRAMTAGQLLHEVPVEPADDVRDMTGAGDAFNAGFLCALLADGGPDLAAAVRSGHALARRVLTHPGATLGAGGES